MNRKQSKINARGYTTIPAEVRRKMGVGPGSVVDWDEINGEIVVRRAGCYTSEDLHRMLFPEGQPKGPPIDVDDAIRARMRKKHTRR